MLVSNFSGLQKILKPQKLLNKKYSITVIIFVSKSTQLTSDGGSYKSKKRESTPIKNGNGACKTSTKPAKQQLPPQKLQIHKNT